MGGFVSLTNKATGKTEVVDSDDLPTALASGKYLDPGAVAVRSNGLDTYAESGVAREDKAFAPTIDPGRAQTALGHHIREEANTGLAAAGRAGLGGLASGLSAGLVSPFEDEQEFNPGAAFVGTAIGAIAPALVGDEAGLLGLARFTPAGAITRAGVGTAERLGGGLLAKGAAGALEGSLYGAGQGVGEVLRSDDPRAWEYAASTISSNALFGAGVGGALGVGGGLVERGLKSGREAIESRLAGVAKDGEILAAAPDVMTMDAKALKTERAAELERLEASRAPERQKFADDLQAYRERNRDDGLFKATWGSTDRDIREAGESLKKAEFAVRGVLDTKTQLIENPTRALAGLQRQEQALSTILEWGQQQKNEWAAAYQEAGPRVRADILAGKVIGENPTAMTAEGVDLAVDRELARRNEIPWKRGSWQGLKPPDNWDLIDKFRPAIAKNQELQARIAELGVAPNSERLAAIDAAKEQLDAPHEPSLSERILHHIPGGGLVSELAGLGQRATGRLGKAAGAAAKKTGEAVASFLGAAEKAAPAAAPTATKVLSSVRFGAGPEPKSGELHDLYAARTAELRQQTQAAPDGTIQMTMAARQALHRQLAPIAANDPVGADRIETALATRTAYMSSKIPKHPEVGGIQVGPDNWRPGDLQMRSWARTVRACEDPHGVELRLAAGTVTPEDAEAYRTCYPQRFRQLQQDLFAAVPTLPKTLSTAKKVSLFTFTGVPTMPALQPNVFKVLQASFAMEPGAQAGGSAAPKPMPSFGALGTAKSMDQPTPAQKRSG